MSLTDFFDYLLFSLAEKLAPARPPRPPEPIREAPDGKVRIRGHVRARGPLLRAPATGRPCVGFHLVVYERHVLRRMGREFEVLLDIEEACPFAVADDSGEANVDTSNPFELDLEAERRGLPQGSDPASRAERDCVTRLLESRGFSATNLLGLPRYISYEEGILGERQEVSVSGKGVREVSPDGDAATPRSPPMRLTLRGTARSPLRISNTRGGLR